MRLGTMLSLFSGSGGFEKASRLVGIEPVMASEVKPYPIAVTVSRFPKMKHLGSVADVKGDEIEPVDVITFGSPCQDLSIAGTRSGLKHEGNGDEETTRSGLFLEAIRIAKEMRKATGGLYPRFIVWENVHGAFSSSKGEDFRTVLEQIIQIAEPTAIMPPIPKGGGTTTIVTAETDGRLLIELSMRNTGEFPNVAVESTLSQILQANVLEKYFLSSKACAGILRRAEKRGKALPPMLKTALLQQMERMSA